MKDTVKKSNKVAKPRNYVNLAMIRSGKISSVHQKDHRKEILEQIQDEEFDELYNEYDDGSY